MKWLKDKITSDSQTLEVNARSWAMTLGRTVAALSLAEHAYWEYEETGVSPAAYALDLLYGGDCTGTFMPWDTKDKTLFKEMLTWLIGLALDTDHRKGFVIKYMVDIGKLYVLYIQQLKANFIISVVKPVENPPKSSVIAKSVSLSPK